ncbi:hypothetical protein RUND412_005946 [Rhizina undulata]
MDPKSTAYSLARKITFRSNKARCRVIGTRLDIPQAREILFDALDRITLNANNMALITNNFPHNEPEMLTNLETLYARVRQMDKEIKAFVDEDNQRMRTDSSGGGKAPAWQSHRPGPPVSFSAGQEAEEREYCDEAGAMKRCLNRQSSLRSSFNRLLQKLKLRFSSRKRELLESSSESVNYSTTTYTSSPSPGSGSGDNGEWPIQVPSILYTRGTTRPLSPGMSGWYLHTFPPGSQEMGSIKTTELIPEDSRSNPIEEEYHVPITTSFSSRSSTKSVSIVENPLGQDTSNHRLSRIVLNEEDANDWRHAIAFFETRG